jgi:hypothetical protein
MADSDQSKRPIIVKRKKVVGGGGHHGGAWKVAIFCPSCFQSRRVFGAIEIEAASGPGEASF